MTTIAEPINIEKYLTRAQRKQAKKVRRAEQIGRPGTSMSLKTIEPMTATQGAVFRDFDNGLNLLLHGYAGTGKSFISLYLASKLMQEDPENYKQIYIIRSVVPSRDMGFLPGTPEEKAKVYEAPYKAIFAELYGRGDAYDVLKQKKQVIFETTSFLQGLTIPNSIVIIDEAENMEEKELDNIITRMGANTRVIFCGDFRQTAFKFRDEREAFLNFMEVLKDMPDDFSCIEFNEDDIVRSPLVKRFILAKERFNDGNYNRGLERRGRVQRSEPKEFSGPSQES